MSEPNRKENEPQEATSIVEDGPDDQDVLDHTSNADPTSLGATTELENLTASGKASFDKKEFSEAEGFYRQALELCEKLNGPNGAGTLSRMMDLGQVLQCQDEHEVAVQIFRQTVKLSQQVHGPQHEITLFCTNYLATSVAALGSYESDKETEELYVQVLDLCRKVWGPEDSRTQRAMYDLANSLLRLGKLDEAEDISRLGLEQSERLLGLDDLETVRLASLLANILRSQGEYDAAEEMYRRVLKSEKAMKASKGLSKDTTARLAEVLWVQGKAKEAKKLWKEISEEKNETEADSDTASEQKESKHERDEQAFRQLVNGLGLPLENPLMLRFVNNLAESLSAQGKLEEAEQMYRRTLEGFTKAFGEDNRETLWSAKNLGLVLHEQGRFEEAEQMHRRAIKGYETIYDKDYPETLSIIDSLGQTLQAQGKYEEAERMYRRSLEERENIVGKGELEILMRVAELGSFFREQGKYEKEEQLYRQRLEENESMFGTEHPSTLISVHFLGILYRDRKDYAAAVGLFKRSYIGTLKKFGPDHPVTKESLAEYSAVLTEIGGRNVEPDSDAEVESNSRQLEEVQSEDDLNKDSSQKSEPDDNGGKDGKKNAGSSGS